MKSKMLKILSYTLAMSVAASSVVSANILPGKTERIKERQFNKETISENEIPIFTGAPPIRVFVTIPNKEKEEKLPISDNHIGNNDKHEIKKDNNKKHNQPSVSKNEVPSVRPIHDKDDKKNEKPSVSDNACKEDVKKDRQEFTKNSSRKENPAKEQAEEIKTEEEKIETQATALIPPIYAEKVRVNKKLTVLVSTTGDGKGSVSNVDSSSKKVVIPKYVKVNDEKVLITSIEKNAFKDENITSVTIPSSVTAIASEAFAGCEKLTKVTIPKSVKTIGAKAFYGCKNLKNITIKSTSVKKIGSDAFSGISSKATIKVPKKKLAYYKKLLKGKIPTSVKIK